VDLERWISLVLDHYKTATTAWDILNEGIESNGNPIQTTHWSESTLPDYYSSKPSWWRYLRQEAEEYQPEPNDAKKYPHPWFASIGPEYVWYAYFFARQYSPDETNLYYNDFGMEGGKATPAINMANDLNARYASYISKWNAGTLAEADKVVLHYKTDQTPKAGKLIDAIGMQQHLEASTSGTIQATIRAALTMFKNAGMKVVISEFTVNPYNYNTEFDNRRTIVGGNGYVHYETIPNFPNHTVTEPGELSALYQMKQALMAAQAFEVYKEFASTIDRVSIFGINSNMTSWRPFSLPFDNSSRAKPMAYAILNSAEFVADHPSSSLGNQWK
jgi:GH35 family endo-1,4-beta-xylanase